MKVSNHQCYYCTPYHWEFYERFFDYCRWKSGSHSKPHRFNKNKPISRTSRRLIEKGIFDDVDLTKNINVVWETILNE